ncbi:hypothetical protein D4764_01G0015190 [Takifugu flavidus]|uniref:CCHC-type domain-containing protein n=1 Tax=Takifugu flavidus TaxID=433684 RepID=A0A5C6PPW6_9TELE|nr:hypothetical protein D4764_01G0015190 [Takifugu flavidus]
MVFASSENMRCFGCGAEGHQVHSCPEKCGAQWTQPAMAVAAAGPVSAFPQSFAAAAVAGTAPAPVTVPVDSAVVVVPVAPTPVVALAEGVSPTAVLPLVMEAPVTVENNIVGESPGALFDPSVDETFVSQSGGGKGGRCAGVERHARRRHYRPVPPSIIMGNVRSLPNMMDKLAAVTRHQREYRECSLLLFTESWLTVLTTDMAAQLDGYTLLRVDRSKESDFNHASPSSSLPKFTQFVTCHTRDNKTLDLFYANTKEAYHSLPWPVPTTTLFDQAPTPPPAQSLLLLPSPLSVPPIDHFSCPPSPFLMTFGPLMRDTSHSSPCPSPPPTPPCSSLSLTPHQVRMALKKNRARKATGSDGISPRLLKSCADQLCGIFSPIFNLSLKLRRVPQLWKTSCIVPVPKTPHPKKLNSYRAFSYQPSIGVDDAVIYLLHTSLTHLEKAGSTARIMFFYSSSAFNTTQPRLLGDKLRGTVLAPFLFTLYTADFSYSTSSCHLQKFSDSAALGLIADGGMDRLVRRASSVLGCPLDSVEMVGNGRMMAKLSSMLNNMSHPLQDTLAALGSSFSERLLHPRCVKERNRRSFLPAAEETLSRTRLMYGDSPADGQLGRERGEGRTGSGEERRGEERRERRGERGEERKP